MARVLIFFTSGFFIVTARFRAKEKHVRFQVEYDQVSAREDEVRSFGQLFCRNSLLRSPENVHCYTIVFFETAS
jgi:hypothetical protein